MKKQQKKSSPAPKKSGAADSASTHEASASKNTRIWGSAEADDFVKVPRCLLRPGASSVLADKKLQPRHLLLLLSLAERKFQNKRPRAYWEEIASDLQIKKDTVRKWAYELRDMGLIKIKNHHGRDPDKDRVGYRNERNSFDLSPFVDLVEQAYRERKNAKETRRQRTTSQSQEGEDE